MNSSRSLTVSSKTFSTRCFVVLFLPALMLPPLRADEGKLKTGKALEAAMMVNITWSSAGDTVGEQLRNLQQHSGVSILRDRRIDPNQPVSLTAVSVSRFQLIQQISDALPEASCCVTDNMVLVGPSAATFRLPILVARNEEELAKLRMTIDASAFRKMVTSRDCSWKMLAEPRQILIQHAKLAGITIQNPSDIPHDVWPASQIPEMPFVEFATIVLNQFDLTVDVDSRKPELVIVPIDLGTRLQHRFLVPARIRNRLTEMWAESTPAPDVKWSGANATVTGSLAQLAILNSMLEKLRFAGPPVSGSISKVNSIRTQSFLLKAESSTVRQLVEYFRMNKIPIDVTDEDSSKTSEIFDQVVRLTDLKEKLPGTEFFPQVFGEYFRKVEVLDDRVILSN